MSARWVALGLAVVAVVYLIYRGTQQGLVYYHTPTELRGLTDVKSGARLRVGGLVEAGSMTKEEGTLRISFKITDGTNAVDVEYSGAPPDLFQEGKGAIAEGFWTPGSKFTADNLLVKHSEEYKPVYNTSSGAKPPYKAD